MSHFVLVADLDRSVLGFFRTSLSGGEVQVIGAQSRADAMARAAAWTPALAVVGTDFGHETLDLVRDLRREFGLRSVVAAGAGQDGLVAAALESGAVGFVVLPLPRAEAAARIRELLISPAVTDGRYVTAGPVTLDLEGRALVRPRPRAALTPCEFEMLRWLLTPPGRTFTRRQLLATDRAAFPPHPSERLVDRHLASLRRKLGEAGALIERTGEIGWRFALRRAGSAEIEFPLTNVTYEV